MDYVYSFSMLSNDLILNLHYFNISASIIFKLSYKISLYIIGFNKFN